MFNKHSTFLSVHVSLISNSLKFNCTVFLILNFIVFSLQKYLYLFSFVQLYHGYTKASNYHVYNIDCQVLCSLIEERACIGI